MGLLLSAAARAQAPNDDFNTFPKSASPDSVSPPAPPAPVTKPGRAETPPSAQPQPPAQPLPRAVSAPAVAGAPSGQEGAAAKVRLLPGSPPPGPSTLGVPFVDERNTRLSQGLFGGLALGLNVSSADIGPGGVLRFAAVGEYYSNSGWPRAADAATRTAGHFAVDFVPLDWLELYASYSASSTSNTGSDPRFISAVGDVTVGAKLSWRVSRSFALALDVRATRLPGVGSQDLDDAGYTLAPYLLLAWTPPIPLRLGFQLGAQFQWNGSVPSGNAEDDIALERTSYNLLVGGISLEFPIPVVTPFVEFTTALPVNVKNATLTGASGNALAIHAALPHQLNFGLKFSFVENLTFLFAGQFSLQSNVALGVPAVAPWNLVFALTFAADLFPKPATLVVQAAPPPPLPAPFPTGTVVGVVTDASTSLPLGGVVVTVEDSDMAPVATDTALGQFLTRPLPPGPWKLRLQRDGYEAALLEVAVAASLATSATAALTPLAKRSHFLVTTTFHKAPVAAKVRFSGIETKVVETHADAAAPTPVPALPGAYVAEVTAEGYLAQLREVEVSPGAELQLAFELQPEPKKKRVLFRDDRLELLVQVHFAQGRATILADSNPLLDEVVDAMVRFGIKRVRVEGYSDSSGSRAANLRLSQTRAEAVAEYLAQKGVARGRLEAKGYGDARPLAPNLTARGRELNRRVEIVVLEK
jgi:OOP family OmpA-OmpF porin